MFMQPDSKEKVLRYRKHRHSAVRSLHRIAMVTGNRLYRKKDGLLCLLEPESIAEAVISLVKDRDKRIRLGNAAKEKDIVHKGEIQLLLELNAVNEVSGTNEEKGSAGNHSGI